MRRMAAGGVDGSRGERCEKKNLCSVLVKLFEPHTSPPIAYNVDLVLLGDTTVNN